MFLYGFVVLLTLITLVIFDSVTPQALHTFKPKKDAIIIFFLLL